MTIRIRRPVRFGVFLLVLLLLAGLGAWGWYASTRPETREVTLFYTDAQAMYLVPVSEARALPRDDGKALGKLLNELTQAPVGLQATLPQGTVAEVQRISNGQANITLQLPGTMGSGAERLMAGAVVKTAASLGSVREVRLQLRDRAGKAYESQHLDLSTPLSPTDPGVENLYLDATGEGLMVTLYYATPDGRYLVPLRRPLPAAYRTQPLEGSFQLLIAGPPAELQGILAPSVPAPPGIGWGGVSSGVARIHWPEGQPAPSEQALRAFALTLTEFDGIRQVSLTRQDQEIASSLRPQAVNVIGVWPPSASPATGSLKPDASPSSAVYPAP
ncbi:Sporulation and spore germination [compost metagenome]